MIELASTFFHFFVFLIRLFLPGGLKNAAAENLALRSQLLLVKRKQKRVTRLSWPTRLALGLSAFLLDSKRRIDRIAILVSPDTIKKFHRFLVKRKYRKLFSNKSKKSGPKGKRQEIINLVLEIKTKKPSYGCSKIALLVTNTTGESISEDTVRRILRRHNRSPDKARPSGPSWLTAFANAKDSLWSIDLFRIESCLLNTHWVLAVIDVHTRRIVGFGIHAGDNVAGVDLCFMFNQILSNHNVPKRISRDNDPLYKYLQWVANIDIVGIEELHGPPYTPTANPFVERLIGTTRREFLDQIIFWNEHDLKIKLDGFVDYYNNYRVHEGIKGSTPKQMDKNHVRKTSKPEHLKWKKCCNGLYEVPFAA